MPELSWLRLDRADLIEAQPPRAAGHLRPHIGIGIDRVDDARMSDRASELEGEGAEAGADIGDLHAWPQLEPAHDPIAVAATRATAEGKPFERDPHDPCDPLPDHRVGAAPAGVDGADGPTEGSAGRRAR